MSVFGKWKGRTLSGFDAQKISRNFLPYSVLLAALFAMTFFGVCLPNTGPRGPRGSAAHVMDETIQYREFRRTYENLSRQNASSDGDISKIAQQTLETLIQIRVLSLLSEELGLRASEQSVISSIQNESIFHDAKSGKFDAQKFRTFLSNAEYTESGFFEEQRRDLTNTQFQEFVRGTQHISRAQDDARDRALKSQLTLEYLKWDPKSLTPEITAEEVTEFLASDTGSAEAENLYNLRKAEYQREEKRRGEQILIQFDGARNALNATRTKDHAQVLAEELLSKILAAPDTFAELARESSDDASSKDKGGDMGFLARNDTVPELSEVLFSLEDDTLHPKIVSSPFGFHIVRLKETQKALNLSFEQVRQQLAQEILTQRQQKFIARAQAFATFASLTGTLSAFTGTNNPDTKSADGETKDNASDAKTDRGSDNPDSAGSTEDNPDSSPPTMTAENTFPKVNLDDLTWMKSAAFSPIHSNIDGIGDSTEIVTAALIALMGTSGQQPELPLVINQPFLVEESWYLVRVVDFKPPPPSSAEENTDKSGKLAEDDPSQSMAKLIRQYQMNQRGQQYLMQIFENYWTQLDQSQQIKRNPDYTELGR